MAHRPLINREAMARGIVGRPGAPFRATDLDIEHYVWLVESIAYAMGEENAKTIDKLYEDAARASAPKPVEQTIEERDAARNAFLSEVFS